MNSTRYIAGVERVVEALGYWPSFHDAEVITFSAERALPFKAGATTARIAVHVREYQASGQGTANYQQELCKSVLIHFTFLQAEEIQIDGFNHQNVINSLTVHESPAEGLPALEVNIESIWGFGGTLRCASVAIESVESLLHE
jgi:hypothetical protein